MAHPRKQGKCFIPVYEVLDEKFDDSKILIEIGSKYVLYVGFLAPPRSQSGVPATGRTSKNFGPDFNVTSEVTRNCTGSI